MQKQQSGARLDVEALAADGATLEGDWPAARFGRLMESVPAECDRAALPPIRWRATGELKKQRAAEPQVWLHLVVQARIPLVCQRCLEPVETALAVDTSLRFVRGEDTAAELDAQSDADVLALTKSLDLETLVEDELLLSIPLVPRHEHCPIGLCAPDADEQAEHPFAALEALRRRPPPGP